MHHCTDLWRGTAPINSTAGIWVTGAAWLCNHLWEHYEFTQDLDFLKYKAYPLMTGAAQFFVDFLVEDPKTGWLVSSPSTSPEIGGLVAGPTMDHQIIRSLFRNCIKAAEILNVDSEFKKVLEDKLSKIAPNQIGKHGQLQEWMQDVDDPNEHHRHVSHLWGLYPGNEINWRENKDVYQAAKKSLEFRGDDGTGWSLAWKINFWARFLDAEHAYKIIHMLLSPAEHEGRKSKGGTYPNMFDAHPPFQIDGNFGGAAGITELLLQSHLGELHLLPALPKALGSGSVKGICARGGFELDMIWEQAQLKEVKILSKAGNTCKLRYRNMTTEFSTQKGRTYKLGANLYL
jgi:alpha-L-fucosidase 2